MQTIKLGHVLTDVAMGPFGSNLKAESFQTTGVPVIRGQNLNEFYVSNENLAYVSPEKAAELSRSLASPGEIIVTHRGTLGQVSMIPFCPRYPNYLVSQSQMRLKVDSELADPRFVTYWMRSRIGQHTLLSFAVQTGVPAIARPTSSLRDYPIALPSLTEQIAIADLLGSLDDKIAANNDVVQRANALSTAFVRIDFEESSRKPLKDLTSLISRGVTPQYDDSGGYTVLNQRCIRDSRVDVAPSRTMRSLPKNRIKILCKNDVLVNSTGQGTLGRIARWISPAPDTAVDTHVSIVRFNPDLADPAFAGTMLSTMERLVEDLAEGSTGQTELKRDLLGSLELSLPPLEKQRQVGQKIILLDDLCQARLEENIVLANTRDELLPLLMSGKITVKEAGQEAVAAGAHIPSQEGEA